LAIQEELGLWRPDPILLTVGQVAQMLNIGRSTVYQLIGEGASKWSILGEPPGFSWSRYRTWSTVSARIPSNHVRGVPYPFGHEQATWSRRGSHSATAGRSLGGSSRSRVGQRASSAKESLRCHTGCGSNQTARGSRASRARSARTRPATVYRRVSHVVGQQRVARGGQGLDSQ
jgi:hypothetical protein